MSPPCTVKLIDPLTPALPRPDTLPVKDKYEKPTLTLPARWPLVNTKRALPLPPPCVVWHRTDVSASHAVLSHALNPADPFSVYALAPKLPPMTVKLPDPEAPAFDRRTPLTSTTPAEKPRDTLPLPAPDDTESRRLPDNKRPA